MIIRLFACVVGQTDALSRQLIALIGGGFAWRYSGVILRVNIVVTILYVTIIMPPPL